MLPQREITYANLEDGDSRFLLQLFEWENGDPFDQGDGWLTVNMSVEGPDGGWSGRSSVRIRPELAGLAASARISASGENALPVLWDAHAPRLAFDFAFDPAAGYVEVAVVVDDGAEAADERHIRLRVPPSEVQAFAEAVDHLASKCPDRLAWVG